MVNESTAVLLVSQYMTRSPISIDANAGVTMAATLMEMNHFHHLPVTRDGKVVGMISARDLFISNALGLPEIESMRVGDIAKKELYMVSSSTPLNEVVCEMTKRKTESVILLDGEAVIGIFTSTDALHALANLSKENERSSVK